MDPIEFLSQHAPFAGLDRDARAKLAEGLEIHYEEEGASPLHPRMAKNDRLSVIRKGLVEIQANNGPRRQLGPGDCFGQASLISNTAPTANVRCLEDCIIYTVSKASFDAISAASPGFSTFFMLDLARRLRRRPGPALAHERSSLTAPVHTLLKKPAVTGDVQLTIREAAQRMAEHEVSSILLSEPGGDQEQLVGIITDRDLRRRVLATGLDSTTPVSEVMSRPLRSEHEDASAFDAMLKMVDLGIHHLPILDGRGRARGVITHDDLLRQAYHSPANIVKRVQATKRLGPAEDFGEEVTALVVSLVNSGLSAVRVGAMVASLNDALIGRFCQLAEAELGPSPLPWAWIAFGSEGRREQALLTDQDNALIYADPPAGTEAEAESYFRKFATLVVEAAIASGIPACKGGYMAHRWCMPKSEWCQRFQSWIGSPTPEAMMHAANIFDFRVCHGTLAVTELEQILVDAGRNTRFLNNFARQVLAMGPRLNLLTRWLDLDRSVDLKAEGLITIVGTARIYALACGRRAGGTLHRLREAAQHGDLGDRRSESLGEAFEFLFRLRLEHQLELMREGLPLSNEIQLGALSALDRRHLRDCLHYIDEDRELSARRFGVEGL